MQMNDKNRAILHYGCGGLGNRLQVLGWCIDKAIEHQMKIYPMWNDSLSWREDFFDKFNISSDLIFDISKYDSSQVKTNLLNLPTELLTDSRQFQNYFTETDETKIPNNVSLVNHIFHVVEAECRAYFNSNSIEDGIYLMPAFCIKYKDNIFKHLSIQDKVKHAVNASLDLISKPYTCWHIRYTDKSNGIPIEDIFKEIETHPSQTKVIVTDSAIVKQMSIERDMICLSRIPRVVPPTCGRKIPGGGAHHRTDAQLANDNLTKDDVNMSAIVDMFIAGMADEFIGTCAKTSSYSWFIDRGRNTNWFKQQLK